MRYSLNVCVSFGRVVAATVLLLLVSASAERSCLCEDGGRNVSLCTTDFVVCAGGEPVTGLEDWFLTIPLVVLGQDRCQGPRRMGRTERLRRSE